MSVPCTTRRNIKPLERTPFFCRPAGIMPFLVMLVSLSMNAFGANLPNAPQPVTHPHKVYFAEASVLAVSCVFDGISTAKDTRMKLEESNPLMGKSPSGARYAAVAIPQDLGVALISWTLESNKHKFMRVAGHGLMMWETGQHVFGATYNAYWQHRVIAGTDPYYNYGSSK